LEKQKIIAQESEQLAAAASQVGRTVARMWAFRLFVGAIVCVGLGTTFLFDKRMRSDPTRLAIDELVLGIGLSAGGVFLALVAFRLFQRK
jgi:hypothetical protein